MRSKSSWRIPPLAEPQEQVLGDNPANQANQHGGGDIAQRQRGDGQAERLNPGSDAEPDEQFRRHHMGKQAGERMGGGAERIFIAGLALFRQQLAERQRARAAHKKPAEYRQYAVGENARAAEQGGDLLHSDGANQLHQEVDGQQQADKHRDKPGHHVEEDFACGLEQVDKAFSQGDQKHGGLLYSERGCWVVVRCA